MVHKVLENKTQLRKYRISAEMPHSKVSHPNVIEIHHRRFADLFPGVSEIGREPLNDKCLLSVGYIVFQGLHRYTQCGRKLVEINHIACLPSQQSYQVPECVDPFNL